VIFVLLDVGSCLFVDLQQIAYSGGHQFLFEAFFDEIAVKDSAVINSDVFVWRRVSVFQNDRFAPVLGPSSTTKSQTKPNTKYLI